jgi:hypothetical protein
MYKLKNVLLNHFNDCATTQNNEVLFKDVILIILSYTTPYYEDSLLNFNCANQTLTIMTEKNTYAIIMRTLTNNRIATGYNNGTICVWDLTNRNTIIKLTLNYKFEIHLTPSERKKKFNAKNLKYTISDICQIDNNTIVYGFKNYNHIIIWNFKDDTTKLINQDNIKNNKIFMIEKDLIAFTDTWKPLTLLNLDTKEYENYEDFKSPYISLMNNKIIISSYKGNNKLKIKIFDKDAFISSVFIDETIYESEQQQVLCESSNCVPCFNKFSSKCTLNNNIIIIRSCYHYGGPPCNTILVCNIVTKKSITILENIQGYILSIIYLNNGYFAMLINDDIMIYHIPTKLCIQTIKNLYNKYLFIEPFNDGFITIDSTSNVTIYE